MINVFHIVSGKNWGGAEQYAYDLVSRLRHDDRFYVEVVCKKNKTVLEQFRKLEVPVSILPLKGMTDLDSPMRFARQLRKGHNIVHVHTFHDAFLAVWARRVSENRNTTIIMTTKSMMRIVLADVMITTMTMIMNIIMNTSIAMSMNPIMNTNTVMSMYSR